ncbi:MAG: hypothetical protein II727_10350 [Oscillospiraceae bacterium]|nr:hypothetical protein [Oscillospiraceae bacterium]
MNLTLYRALQWLWGLPQTLAGAVMAFAYRRNPHFSYRGTRVTIWDKPGSLSLGMFLFLSRALPGVEGTQVSGLGEQVLLHEYGHTLQSLMLGPLFLLVIGAPSLAWAGSKKLAALRAKKHVSYYSLYTERWANRLGKVTGLK